MVHAPTRAPPSIVGFGKGLGQEFEDLAVAPITFSRILLPMRGAALSPYVDFWRLRPLPSVLTPSVAALGAVRLSDVALLGVRISWFLG